MFLFCTHACSHQIIELQETLTVQSPSSIFSQTKSKKTMAMQTCFAKRVSVKVGQLQIVMHAHIQQSLTLAMRLVQTMK